MNVISARKPELTGDDNFFKIELKLISSLCGLGAVERTHSLIMDIFPSKSRVVSELQVLATLNTLVNGPGFKFLPPVPQAAIKFGITLATAVSTKTVDTLSLKNVSAHALQVWTQCSCFCRYKGSIDGKKDDDWHTGGDAILAILQHLRPIVGKGTKPSEGDLANITKELDLLHRYGEWLSPSTHKAEVANFVKLRGESKAKAKAKAKSKTKQQDSAAKSAADMFS